MNKSVISVKYTLMLILITIIAIGLAAVVSWISSFFRANMCIQEQIKAVTDIEGLMGGVKTTGNPAIEKIKLNGVCTECIWFNTSQGFRRVEIKFKGAVTPVPVDVSMQWGGVDTDYGCPSNMEAGQTHYIEITPNYISCVSCA